MRQKVKLESCGCCHITMYNVFGYIRTCSSGVIIFVGIVQGSFCEGSMLSSACDVCLRRSFSYLSRVYIIDVVHFI